MRFPRIEGAIATCDVHVADLDRGNAAHIEIETHLVAALVLVVVSEYEEFIEEKVGERADRCGDPHVASYVRNQIARRFRSPDLGKITETLGFFGQDYVDQFRTRIENTRFHASWDNIIRARHAVVHQRGVLNMTLTELKASYEDSKEVLLALISALDS